MLQFALLAVLARQLLDVSGPDGGRQSQGQSTGPGRERPFPPRTNPLLPTGLLPAYRLHCNLRRNLKEE